LSDGSNFVAPPELSSNLDTPNKTFELPSPKGRFFGIIITMIEVKNLTKKFDGFGANEKYLLEGLNRYRAKL